MRAGEGIWGRKREPQQAVLDQNQPDLASQVTRALSIQGYVPAKLDPLIQLGVTSEDLTRPEFWQLRRGRFLAGGINLPAVAAQLGATWLKGADNVLTIVERIEIFNRNAALQSVAIGLQGAAPAAGGGARAYNRDSRAGVWTPGTATVIAGGNSAAPTVPTFYVRALIGAGQLWVNEEPWVLTGTGAFLTFVNDLTVNQTLDVNVYWRERVLLDSETL